MRSRKNNAFCRTQLLLQYDPRKGQVCIGCLNEQEAEEDMEFGLAAIERRMPEFNTRSSPLKTDLIAGATANV